MTEFQEKVLVEIKHLLMDLVGQNARLREAESVIKNSYDRCSCDDPKTCFDPASEYMEKYGLK